jgi:hypothetical protein
MSRVLTTEVLHINRIIISHGPMVMNREHMFSLVPPHKLGINYNKTITKTIFLLSIFKMVLASLDKLLHMRN